MRFVKKQELFPLFEASSSSAGISERLQHLDGRNQKPFIEVT